VDNSTLGSHQHTLQQCIAVGDKKQVFWEGANKICMNILSLSWIQYDRFSWQISHANFLFILSTIRS